MKNVLFTAFFAGMALCASAQKTVFVSPTGNDAWAGDRNRPFKTLNRAFAESENSRDTLYIQVASGDYFLEKSLDLSGGLNCPVVVKGNEKNKPRFLGGIKIQQWEKCRDGVYRAFVPEVKRYGYQFEQFFVNGVRPYRQERRTKIGFT